MDFSKFSDGDFEVTDWVNGALRAHKETQAPLDVHASTLVMKLQLFIQEVNKAIEDTSMQMVQNLPRILRDVESVRQEATLLNEQMTVVKADIKKVESDTSQSMQRLVELDTLKKRMLLTQSALQEADNWTTLSDNVEEVFATRDVQKIAERLVGMQQSLRVLHDVPDYDDRKKVLEALKNRLEALLSPRLITSFNTHSLEEAQCYVQIFVEMERYLQLEKYFIGCRKSVIHQLWSQLYDPDKRLIECVSSFYDKLLGNWHQELMWCSQVFPEPLPLMSALFSQSVESITPPLGRCLGSMFEESGHHDYSNRLALLIELRQASMRFIKGLQRSLSSGHNNVFGFVEVIHLPYCQLLVKYPSMEAQLLKHNLHSLDLVFVDGVEETVSQISNSVPKIFTFCSEALERCMQLTEGWGLPGVIRAVEALTTQYVSKLASSIHQIRRGCGLDVAEVEESMRGEEWTHLQHAFSVIKSCGEMQLRTMTLNSNICSTTLTSTNSIREPANESLPFGCYDYLSSYHPEEHTAVMELVATVHKGGRESQLLTSALDKIHSLNEQAHKLAFDIIFAMLKGKLSQVPQLKVWETGITSPQLESPRALMDDLPSFSLSPLSYITEIGDYLLTLPQQLEPFTSDNSPALVHALQHGHLPFPATETLNVPEGDIHPSEDWLGAIARGTMDTYLRSIFRIPSLSETAAHQLATDVAYLCNVLAALGQSPTDQMAQMELLLKADKNQFERYKEDENISSKFYQDISNLRKWQC